jgi:ubiquinol-cytochrome c reductase cytochrome c subunit
VALALQIAGGGPTLADPRTVAHGKAIYFGVGCSNCHGGVGQGSILTGPALAPLQLSDEAVVRYVRRPTGLMPPFSATILSENDLQVIIAYLRSQPPTRPPSEIPLLAPYVASSRGK